MEGTLAPAEGAERTEERGRQACSGVERTEVFLGLQGVWFVQSDPGRLRQAEEPGLFAEEGLLEGSRPYDSLVRTIELDSCAPLHEVPVPLRLQGDGAAQEVQGG